MGQREREGKVKRGVEGGGERNAETGWSEGDVRERERGKIERGETERGGQIRQRRGRVKGMGGGKERRERERGQGKAKREGGEKERGKER